MNPRATRAVEWAREDLGDARLAADRLDVDNPENLHWAVRALVAAVEHLTEAVDALAQERPRG